MDRKKNMLALFAKPKTEKSFFVRSKIILWCSHEAKKRIRFDLNLNQL